MKDEAGAQIKSDIVENNRSPRRRTPASPLLRKWRNAILSTLLVLLGLGMTGLILIARRAGDMRLANIAAIASLVVVLLIIILVVPPLVRSARAEVSRFDLPLQITKGGMIFLGVVGVVAFAAWNTGNNLLFLLFSLLTSTLFIAWAAARASLRDLIVSARFPDHIYAGEPAPVIVTIKNTKRFLPSFSILVEARGPIDKEERKEKRRQTKRVRFGKRTLAYFMYVPHRAAAEQHVEQLFERRGHELITGFELSTRFPFGFFRRRRRLRARDVDIIVYPKPEPLSDELHLLPMNAGRLISARRGAGGHDLFSLRDYQPQDDLRYIDRKATARARRLIVREFTAEDERRVTIALDTKEHDAGAKDFASRFERGVTLAASLTAHFIDERAEVRLVIGEETERYGVGLEHLYSCLRRLALALPDDKRPESSAQLASAWTEIDSSSPAGDDNYVILLTTAAPGSIPANVWRTSHVIYL